MATPASVLGATLKTILNQSVDASAGVSSWVDDLAAAGPAIQATGGNRPSLLNSPSGAISVDFDGSSDFLKSPGFTATAQQFGLLFFVFKCDGSTGSDQYVWVEQNTSTVDEFHAFIRNSDGKLVVGSTFGVSPAVSNASVVDGNWHTVMVYVDSGGVAQNLYLDGTLQTTTGDKSGSAWLSGSTSTGGGSFGGFRLGTDTTQAAGFFNGQLAVLGYAWAATTFSSLLSTLHTALFDTYLKPGIILSPTTIALTLGSLVLQKTNPGGRNLSVFYDSAAASWFDDEPNFELDETAASGAYTLPITTRSIAFTGQGVTLTAQRKLAVSNASATITGQDVAFRVTLPISAASITVTPQAIALRATRTLSIGTASVTFTGQSIGFDVKLPIANASITASTNPIALTAQRKLAIAPASITVTPQSVLFGVTIPIAMRSIAFSGQSVGLVYTPAPGSYNFVIGTASITIAGQSLALTAQRKLPISVASASLSTIAVGLTSQRRVTVTPASITLSPQAFGLLAARKLPISAGSITVTTVAIAFARGWRVVITAGSITATGQAIAFSRALRIAIDALPISFTGQDVAFTYTFAAPFPEGELTVSGVAPLGIVFTPNDEGTFRVSMTEASASATSNSDAVVVGNAA